MLKHVKVSDFLSELAQELYKLPQGSRVMSVGTNSDDYLFRCVDPWGHEYRIKVKCWEEHHDSNAEQE